MNNFKSTILSLSLALLSLLGACSHEGNDDATLPVAKGGEPLLFNIAPKEQFVTGNPNTRVAVDETTGATSWVEGDRIVMLITFNDAATTKVSYTLVRTAADTWETYEGVVPSRDADGNPSDLSKLTPVTPTWPLGATKTGFVTAGCFDGETLFVSSTSDTKDIAPGIGSTADFMSCTLYEVLLNTPITFNMEHEGSRFVFTGLKANTEYSVSGLDWLYEGSIFYSGGTSIKGKYSIDFTSDANGRFVYCSKKGSSYTSSLVLKEKTTNTTVFSTSVKPGKGKSYHVSLSGGPINPGNNPDLIN